MRERNQLTGRVWRRKAERLVRALAIVVIVIEKARQAAPDRASGSGHAGPGVSAP